MSGDFVHLHVHTEFSLLDGACQIDRLISYAKKLGQKAIAITDHGVMYGAVNFYKACKKEGIKPIIGCEVYTSLKGRHDRTRNVSSSKSYYDYGHLVLLCKNETGYKNLIKLVSLAHTEGYYYKPRIDFELLEKYNEGLICLSACLGGDVPQAILRNDMQSAIEIAKKYKSIFGKENYFLELQDHNLKEQRFVNEKLIEISQLLDIELVATNDAHYIEKSDAPVQNVLLCIQTGRTVNEGSQIGFETEEFYIKSYDEMYEKFEYVSCALENTVKIAQMCNFDFEFGKYHLPQFTSNLSISNSQLLVDLVNSGMKKRYGEQCAKYKKRVEYELDTIKSMGYEDYFLITYDFIKFAKDNDIPVGPGRGSAAGSIVAYALEITDIDPMKYGLLFERFLNPERVSMPDIDVDFCIERRGEVIDYVVEKYSSKRVAQIITFGTLKPRMAIRDVGRALDMPYSDVDYIAKLIPTELNITIEKALDISPQLLEAYTQDSKAKMLIDTAKKLEGFPRHASTHAAGVVITKDEVSSYVPLQMSGDAVITQYPMKTIESLGLLKMDFLGLRNLTVMKNTENLIKKNDRNFDYRKAAAHFDDSKVYDLLSAGDTNGVFQLESSGMKQVLQALMPRSLEDIIAIISLYRPGPMDSIPKYIECKNNPEKIKYKHKLLEPILNMTYGCMVYQEQVMQIVRELAGYSYGRADLVRRAMAKKQADVMNMERQYFVYGKKSDNGDIEIEGAIKRGVSEKVANEIFDEMISFAEYAFNKSHAAAYAVIAYQTAFLKVHYTKEYFAALLTSVLGNTAKTYEYINECESNKIKVLPPDINESSSEFSVSNENIRYALTGIKNVGTIFVLDLVKEREQNGVFLSFYDFCLRMADKSLNKRTVESLIKCGAFDRFGINRKRLLVGYESVIDSVVKDMRMVSKDQLSLFDNGEIDTEFNEALAFPFIDEFLPKELYKMEKEYTGVYISGNPIDAYKSIIEKKNVTRLSSIAQTSSEEEEIVYNFNDGDFVNIAGIISAVNKKITKNNQTMAFLNVMDTTGNIEVIVFAKLYDKYSQVIKEDNAVIISGRISIREEENAKIILNEIYSLDEMANSKKTSEKSVYINVESIDDDKIKQIKTICKSCTGESSVIIHLADTKKLVKMKDIGIKIDENSITKLKKLCGVENIVIK